MKYSASILGLFVVCLSVSVPLMAETNAPNIELTLRYQESSSKFPGQFNRLSRQEQWVPSQTAVIVCDMWDSHHCVNAARRVTELTPRIDQFCRRLREQGVTIIHAPSSCMDAYQTHTARKRAQATAPASSFPPDIGSWCDQIPSEEAIAYPVDQSDGGEDDDLEDHRLWAGRLAAIGRNPRAPWKEQVGGIAIDEKLDFISDSGTEIWSILEDRQVNNVVLVGVHTNMCVLGRPFGLRRLAAAGKNVVLARDLTDTMYNPGAWPYASHFTGTDLIISHIERHVCPTISSNQVLGGQEFRFKKDDRQRLVMLVAEREYQTNETLPIFAAKHLSEHFSVQVCFASDDDPNRIVGIADLATADALLVSVRRRTLAEQDLALVRAFVAQGKPVVGIRTASHAFSLRGKPAPSGKADWQSFDADVFGGNYTNHYGNNIKAKSSLEPTTAEHPIRLALGDASIQPGGSLYKTAPLAPGSSVLLHGLVEDAPPEPMAWTFIRNDGGRSFYTSLGHVDDFAQPEFEALLAAGIHWACGLEPHSLSDIQAQNERYANGQGRQRK